MPLLLLSFQDIPDLPDLQMIFERGALLEAPVLSEFLRCDP